MDMWIAYVVRKFARWNAQSICLSEEMCVMQKAKREIIDFQLIKVKNESRDREKDF